jgi:hypothetical protein
MYPLDITVWIDLLRTNFSSRPTHSAHQEHHWPLDHRRVRTPLDTLIAVHALSLGATLVTGNGKEFQRVAGLVVPGC